MVWAGEGNLPVVLDGKSLAQGTHESPIPMEVDPETRLSLLGDPEYESRPIYAEVVAGLRVTNLRATPSEALAGIKGALVVEVFSPDRPLGKSAEVALAPVFVLTGPRPIKLLRSGRPVFAVPTLQPLSGELPLEVVQAWNKLEAQYGTGPLTGEPGFCPANGGLCCLRCSSAG